MKNKRINNFNMRFWTYILKKKRQKDQKMWF